jgi:hypothetical protein
MLKSLLREPLVHFLLLGAALFGLDAWLRPSAATAGASEIVVSEARIRNLAQNFARAWQRPPTREELNGLVESFVREEVMVREALALGLDRDDAIIRRRLQQKLEFVSDEAVALARPTDEELNAFLQAHPEAFRREQPRVAECLLCGSETTSGLGRARCQLGVAFCRSSEQVRHYFSRPAQSEGRTPQSLETAPD